MAISYVEHRGYILKFRYNKSSLTQSITNQSVHNTVH